jgi:hypothetical protein
MDANPSYRPGPASGRRWRGPLGPGNSAVVCKNAPCRGRSGNRLPPFDPHGASLLSYNISPQ